MPARRQAEESAAPSVSLVLPAYNEEHTIAQAVSEADEALASLTDDYEILVVNDGSTDQTADIAELAAQRHSHVRVIHQPRNLGYGAALRRGFQAATKDLVGFTDADCQFDLRELERLVFLARDYDVVCGYRIDRQDPALRRAVSKVYNAVVRVLLGIDVRDCDYALKLVRRDALDSLEITTNGFLVNAELLTRAGQARKSIVEVGVTHRPRAAGASKVSLAHAFPMLVALLRFWWTYSMFPGCEASRAGTPPVMSQRRLIIPVLLGVLASTLLFTNLRYPLFEPDETRYAQISLEMYNSGDLVVPKFRGEPYLDKPPLLYWMTTASYALFGVSERTARLPLAVAGLFTVLTMCVLGRRLVGDRAACAGALLLLLCVGFPASSRFVMMDGLLTLFTTLGLLLACRALHVRGGAGWYWVAAGAACGMGMLAKGPVAAVICVPPILLACWLSGGKHVIRRRDGILFLIPLVLICTPWYWCILTRQHEFTSYFLWKHHVVRFLHAFDHQEPWWFYLPVIAVGMFPASMLLPGFAVYLLGRQRNDRCKRTSEVGFLVTSGAWIITFFSMSSCKLPAYVLPALPLLCLSLGKMLDDAVWSPDPVALVRRLAVRGVSITMVMALCACIVFGFADLAFSAGGMFGAALALGCVVAPDALLIVIARGGTRWVGRPWAAAALCLAVGLYGFDRVLPEFARWRSVSHNVSSLQRQIGGNVPIIYFRRHPEGISPPDTAGQVDEIELEHIGKLEAYMAQHPDAVVVTDRDGIESIRSQCGNLLLRNTAARGKVYWAEVTQRPVAEIGQEAGRQLR